MIPDKNIISISPDGKLIINCDVILHGNLDMSGGLDTPPAIMITKTKQKKRKTPKRKKTRKGKR